MILYQIFGPYPTNFYLLSYLECTSTTEGSNCYIDMISKVILFSAAILHWAMISIPSVDFIMIVIIHIIKQ